MKVNREGRECPDWCVRDHTDADANWSCVGQRHGTSKAHAEAHFGVFEKDPEVTVWVGSDSGFRAIYADTEHRASWLSDALEHLAGMRKPEIRALAARVREASAEAFPPREAEAG
jgi:hypothetical protein